MKKSPEKKPRVTAERVSIIIPCRNEAKYIGRCLDSMLANDYPKESLEILVMDGMSQDGSRHVVAKYARRYPCVKLLDNPSLVTPAAFNDGIRASHGDIIIIVGAHSYLQSNYISKCVAALRKYKVDSVGGIMRALPQNNTLLGRCIVRSLSHLFGVGNAHFRTNTSTPREVDTVYGGCYRRDVFRRVGMFNERLIRSQDMEFNRRLRNAGGKILLIPDTMSYYFARSSLKAFLYHNLSNGYWAIVPFLYSRIVPVSLRHLVPMVFVLSLLFSLTASLFWPAWIWLLAGIGGTYVIVALLVSACILARGPDRGMFFVQAFSFFLLHVTYGLGSLAGAVRLGLGLLARPFRHPDEVEDIPVYVPLRIENRRGENGRKDSHDTVSIVIPCRNEVKFIGDCLDSILANDYPRDKLEILIVDGMSEDGTREAVKLYTRRYRFIRLVNNPRRITPCALNEGIRRAHGKIVVRLDAHAKYPADYVQKCVRALKEYGADNVGGNMVTIPRDGTTMGRAIAAALSHPFGVGNSYFRIRSRAAKWVDTVFGGCYRRAIFRRVGLFNERLIFSQDLEFNLRLKRAGGRTLLLPSIVSYYYARSDFAAFWKHNLRNGVWVIMPMLYTRFIPISWRHLVPLFFLLGLIGISLLALANPFGRWLLLVYVSLYALGAFGAAAHIAYKEADWRFLFVLPLVFLVLHLNYGLGSLAGVFLLTAKMTFRPLRHA